HGLRRSAAPALHAVEARSTTRRRRCERRWPRGRFRWRRVRGTGPIVPAAEVGWFHPLRATRAVGRRLDPRGLGRVVVRREWRRAAGPVRGERRLSTRTVVSVAAGSAL